ncbi:uncharacterized protein LOC133732842 [Rosa rugosa]|uniref:uncharacterized protein LOC133732842 n=1 Tax=Rosa rugosa TaxID=74645 RepID=UPI002B411700|nr:uncharacterized protein LOC133732842 [Rosa rugosa]XP_062016419.1 uncharacterized protein LOC133732842 [Rosa rugosa]
MAWFSRETDASLPSSAEPLSAAGGWKYDVFLSFMGPDTRRGFTSYLYDALQSRGIKTFMDGQDLQVSDAISPFLLEAIEESRFAIVILSQNYASSTWCLEELTKICECMKDDYRILPLFYYVEPSDVRYQKRSFAEAFSAHEISGRHRSEKVQQWRAALNKVANLCGWTTKDFAAERELLQNIVEFVGSKVLQAPIEIESTMWLKDEPADPRWKYDVFLSFKGEDTRKGFLSHLYHELQNTGVIKTFKDDLEPGEGVHISPTFLKAIEESRFAIVVLTPNYASSPWCLEELTNIFHCMEDQQRILPIFYHVEPSDVRYQKKSFQIAFTKHKKRQDEEKVKQWSSALKKVANLSGWDSRNYKIERQLVEDIVAFVYYKVQAHHIEFGSVEHKKPTDVESLIPIEDSEATTQATDQTLAPRSQRHCSFLPSAPRWKHEVFLSFRDVDACKGITSEIYDNLQNIRGVKTFMNNQEFQVGDLTSPRFLTTIEESRFAIVVLSQNYASSTWCLEELTTIVQCMKDNDRVLPLFYQVDPSAVRYQRGSFEVAFKNHESTEDTAKVEQWRNALKKVADLRGWESHEYGSDKELVEDIVKLVWGKVLQVRIDNESTIRQPKDMTSSRSLASAKPAPRWKYDVFLSFRGEDVRENILSHLYRELSDTRGVKTFKDDQDLEQGTAISPNLLMAIEESKFAVVVLSANYASSTWCLDELIHIFKCMEGKNTILPIFYDVDPSHVQKQEESFKKAFEQHENSGQDEQKMQQWREALKKVATVSGWHSKKYKSESELVEHVGKFVWSKVIQVEVDSTMSTGDFEAFRATRQGMEQVMKALKNDKVYVIGVYGKGGVGKTTMVKHVTAQAQKIGLFNHVFMVSLSQSPDLRKIQGKFADILGLKFQEETDIEKATRLKKRIMGGHKILIVLDNIWNSIDLSSIGIPSSSELQRCNAKVLITTRKIEVCQAMGCQEKINLTMLSEADSLTLFMRQSGKSLESKDFYDAARKVAKQCAGLPIALKAVAKALGDKVDLNQWKKAARRLKKSRTANLDDEGDGFNCIKLSYDYLKGEYVKSCFLLCCLFPDDDDIRIADLMEYGYGIGLFQDSSTMKEARATTHLAVIYLKACNLLMDGAEDGCIRMHDVIRNMAISILHKNGHHFFPPGKTEDGHHFSSPGKKDDGHPSFKPEKEEKDGHHFLIKAGCQLKEWPMDADESYSGISVMRNEILKLPEELICSKLQILLLQGNADINDIPDTFIQSVNSMRVLDLSDTRISSLPPSFSLLKNLHTLYLDGCQSLIDVSALGELRFLV